MKKPWPEHLKTLKYIALLVGWFALAFTFERGLDFLAKTPFIGVFFKILIKARDSVWT